MNKIEKGKVLISEPYIADDNFFRSVILIAEYDEEDGAVGFMLNQITDNTLSEIMEEEYPYLPLFEGGPVQMNELFFLHSIPGLEKSSMEIKENLFWGGDFEEVAPLLIDGVIELDCIKFFIGYSGWAPGQLEAEIKSGSWFISDLKPEEIGSHKKVGD